MQVCDHYTPTRAPGPHRRCTLRYGHDGPHVDAYGTKWEVTSQQPDRAAQVADIQARNALGAQLSGVGFTREELTAAAAAQQKVAPSKEEILAAIDGQEERPWGPHETEDYNAGVNAARSAVLKLFADRGL